MPDKEQLSSEYSENAGRASWVGAKVTLKTGPRVAQCYDSPEGCQMNYWETQTWVLVRIQREFNLS